MTSATPPIIGANTFYSNYTHTINVPCGATEAYQSKAIWNRAYFNYQELDCEMTITAVADDENHGSVSGSGEYTFDTEATLTATPAEGYHFVQWQDGNTDNPRTIVVRARDTYTASFEINNYALTVMAENSAHGMVFGSGTYDYNTEITIGAVPNAGYTFAQWNDGNTSNPRTITITKDSTLVASFEEVPEEISYTLTLTSANETMGTVAGAGTYTENATVMFAAIANDGYRFLQWSDGNTNNPRTLTLTKDSTLVASFEEMPIQDMTTYALTIGTNNRDLGVGAGNGLFTENTQVEIGAIPNEGSRFTQWDDGNTNNPRVVTMGSSNATYTAQFEAINYSTMVYAYGAGGSVSCRNITTGAMGENNSVAGVFGNTIEISATPNANYRFLYWHDGNTQATRNIVVRTNSEFYAVFMPKMFSIQATPNNAAWGNVIGEGEYAYGSQVSLMAVPEEGYRFVGWSDGSTENPYTLLVDGDIELTANFEPSESITDVTGINYTISCEDGVIHVNGASGAIIKIYDSVGRCISTTNSNEEVRSFNMPASGVYMVQVGEYAAEKVVVVK